jgi:uncharacterized protein (TIGR02284 family)
MDIKATFTGKDRTSLLESCEAGEDAAQKAYKDAMETEGLPAEIRDFIGQQKKILRASHDEIKAMRDWQKATS